MRKGVNSVTITQDHIDAFKNSSAEQPLINNGQPCEEHVCCAMFLYLNQDDDNILYSSEYGVKYFTQASMEATLKSHGLSVPQYSISRAFLWLEGHDIFFRDSNSETVRYRLKEISWEPALSRNSSRKVYLLTPFDQCLTHFMDNLFKEKLIDKQYLAAVDDKVLYVKVKPFNKYSTNQTIADRAKLIIDKFNEVFSKDTICFIRQVDNINDAPFLEIVFNQLSSDYPKIKEYVFKSGKEVQYDEDTATLTIS